MIVTLVSQKRSVTDIIVRFWRICYRLESLPERRPIRLQKAIAEYMDKSISFYDAGAEGFYHGLLLGMIALMDNQYKIKSNREAGDGRYEIWNCIFRKESKC